MDEHVAFLNEQVDRHHAWFSKSLPMIASENVISPMAREMLVSDFGDRYAEGLPHEEIGRRLGISSETVRTHLRKASDRLGASTRTQAVATALRLGLIV